MVAKDRQVCCYRFMFFGDGVIVFTSMKRYVHPTQLAKLSCPHATTVDNKICIDTPLICHDAFDFVILNIDINDLDAFNTLGTAQSCTLDESGSNFYRVSFTVMFDKGTADQTAGINQWEKFSDLLRRDLINTGHTKSIVHRSDAA